MEKKKIIVLGSAGNLGMYFIDYLNENLDMDKYEIIATGTKEKYPYDFYKGKYVKVDITKKDDFDKLPKQNVHAAVDFAGVLPAYLEKDNPYKYIDVNVTGTLNLLEYCRQTKVDRIIYTQTWADLNGYLKEKKPLKPNLLRKPIFKGDHAIYAVTKCAAVDLIECYHQMYGLKNFIFRLPNIYLYSPEMYYYVNGEEKGRSLIEKRTYTFTYNFQDMIEIRLEKLVEENIKVENTTENDVENSIGNNTERC